MPNEIPLLPVEEETKRVTVPMEVAMWDRLEEIAGVEKCHRNELLGQAVARWIADYDAARKGKR